MRRNLPAAVDTFASYFYQPIEMYSRDFSQLITAFILHSNPTFILDNFLLVIDYNVVFFYILNIHFVFPL